MFCAHNVPIHSCSVCRGYASPAPPPPPGVDVVNGLPPWLAGARWDANRRIATITVGVPTQDAFGRHVSASVAFEASIEQLRAVRDAFDTLCERAELPPVIDVIVTDDDAS